MIPDAARMALGIALAVALFAPALPCAGCCCVPDAVPPARTSPDASPHTCCTGGEDGVDRVSATALGCGCDGIDGVSFVIPDVVTHPGSSDGRPMSATLPPSDTRLPPLIVAMRHQQARTRIPTGVLLAQARTTRGPPGTAS